MSEYKSISDQRKIWHNILASHEGELYSHQWGVPTDEFALNKKGDLLGDYLSIQLNHLWKNSENKVVLDLGSFDGKWIPYMNDAEKIICVDITDAGFSGIKKRYPKLPIEFHLSNGYDLSTIEDNSVDYIFSMDSLVRSEKGLIDSYIGEFKRVLKPDGKTCVHLPCQEQYLSWELGFSQIDKQEIVSLCWKHGFDNFYLDSDTIKHGVLLVITNG